MVPNGLPLSKVAAKSQAMATVIKSVMTRPTKPNQVKWVRAYLTIHQTIRPVTVRPKIQPRIEIWLNVPIRWNCSEPKNCFSKFLHPALRILKPPPEKRIRLKARIREATSGKIEKIRIRVTAGARNSRPICRSSHSFIPSSSVSSYCHGSVA